MRPRASQLRADAREHLYRRKFRRGARRAKDKLALTLAGAAHGEARIPSRRPMTGARSFVGLGRSAHDATATPVGECEARIWSRDAITRAPPPRLKASQPSCWSSLVFRTFASSAAVARKPSRLRSGMASTSAPVRMPRDAEVRWRSRCTTSSSGWRPCAFSRPRRSLAPQTPVTRSA